jgi:hypothetical protein
MMPIEPSPDSYCDIEIIWPSDRTEQRQVFIGYNDADDNEPPLGELHGIIGSTHIERIRLMWGNRIRTAFCRKDGERIALPFSRVATAARRKVGRHDDVLTGIVVVLLGRSQKVGR